MRRLTVLLVASSLALAGAACGGDDDEGGGGGEPLSQDEFVAQGNEICEEGDIQTEAAFEETFGDTEEEPPADEVEDFIRNELIPVIQDQIDGLRDRTPPETLQEDFVAMLDDAEAALDEVRDMSAEEILSEQDDPFAAVNAQAEELGLTACAD